MKTKEELNALKEEVETLNKKLAELNDDELEKVTGSIGMANPVAGMRKSQAEAIARELGEGQDMGSWKTMSGAKFLEWWGESNNIVLTPSEIAGICGYNDNGTLGNCCSNGEITDKK